MKPYGKVEVLRHWWVIAMGVVVFCLLVSSLWLEERWCCFKDCFFV